MDGDDLNRKDTAHADMAMGDAEYDDVALLLVESLLHGLIARALISVEDAVEIVSVAAHVKEEISTDRGEEPAKLSRSLTRLEAISSSLKLDIQPK